MVERGFDDENDEFNPPEEENAQETISREDLPNEMQIINEGE